MKNNYEYLPSDYNLTKSTLVDFNKFLKELVSKIGGKFERNYSNAAELYNEAFNINDNSKFEQNTVKKAKIYASNILLNIKYISHGDLCNITKICTPSWEINKISSISITVNLKDNTIDNILETMNKLFKND